MRQFLAGLMMGVCVFAWASFAWAHDDAGGDGSKDAAMAAPAGPSKTDVSGIPLYMGPGYSAIKSGQRDVNNMPPEFHSFQARPVDEVGYSPLTLADFRFPVVKRANTLFGWERATYPEHSVLVKSDICNNYEVKSFFFTRDMVRDHIQKLIDEYYICDPDLVQQIIDYYAEVTPQCGEAISWVWFKVLNNYQPSPSPAGNRYFASYLNNFKDKFYLEVGLPKVQDKVDKEVQEFLYQYRDRGKYECGPEFKERNCGCNKCGGKSCNSCDSCGSSHQGCGKCGDKACGGCNKPACGGCGKCSACCPDKQCRPHDEPINCEDMQYHGFTVDPNGHYLYYPRKVVIEDITFDHVAGAYRWKFAWRFNDCEADWLKQMCQYGEQTNMALVLSDPTWYSHSDLQPALRRDILASVDPTTWGNIWPAGNVPFDATCCDCPLPNCAGNCKPEPSVGFELPAPPVEAPPVVEPPAEVPPVFFPPEEPKEVVEVPGKG
jgi:hypothetical protein